MSTFERVIYALAAAVIVVTIAVTGHGAGSDDGASTDGLKHTCGLVTEQGVTENLTAYTERCWPTTTVGGW